MNKNLSRRNSFGTPFSRASLILPLLIIFLLLTTSGYAYFGFKTGELKREFSDPLKNFWKQLTTKPSPTPTIPLPTKAPLPKATSVPTKPVQSTQPKTPSYSNCIRMNIREGEFASNKCYSRQDYEDLQYYLGRYETAKLNLSSAEGFIRIDCGQAADTFEAARKACEKDKQDKAAAEAEVAKYRGIIQGIIAKGK